MTEIRQSKAELKIRVKIWEMPEEIKQRLSKKFEQTRSSFNQKFKQQNQAKICDSHEIGALNEKKCKPQHL